MKDLFREIMDIEGVKGVMLFSSSGDLIYKEFVERPPLEVENKVFWTTVFNVMQGTKECEIVYETSRLYIKETILGYLLIRMELDVRIALVRLSCDMLVASLDEKKAPKGRWGLFKKKK
jgi:hypothetical protein